MARPDVVVLWLTGSPPNPMSVAKLVSCVTGWVEGVGYHMTEEVDERDSEQHSLA